VPWYEDYFTADYWAYADAEYTPERTDAEVRYLAGVLAGHRRVLDLGCGTGRHAIGLARLGFEVTGVDVSDYALRRAAQAAASAGVRLRLCRADLLGSSDWGVPPADAVICVQAFGWGSDADQLRMLRAIRRLMPPGGLLVLDHSSILAIARIYQPRARARTGAAEFTFTRHYDPVSGRSGGDVLVRRGDGTQAVLPDNVRLYTPAEIRELLIRAGFEVTRADADFQIGSVVTIGTRYAQFLATPARPVESALAGHHNQPSAGEIDLRWAPDEAEFSQGAVAAAWARLAADLPGKTLSAVDLPGRARRYDLADPYGAARAASVLAGHLGWPVGSGPGRGLSEDQVSVGAGVTGLLHGLARLADGGTVLIAPAGHPQLADAAAAAGATVAVAALSDPTAASAAVTALRPAVTVLDRPATTGRAWSLPMVAELAASTAQAGGTLVVDETCGCYLPPGTSAAPLTQTVPGLVVLSGVSKGYCCGGLRIGFAVASAGLAAQVRAVLAPLAGSALSLDVALELLSQPDSLGPLRARIAEVKPAVHAALRRAGVAIVETDVHVPWIALNGDAATRATLAQVGLAVKDVPVLRLTSGSSQPPGPAGSSGGALGAAGDFPAGLLRMSVPLSARRYEAVAAALAGADPAGGADLGPF
jgi:histidinol-phosphate/aromatic aminotransferase/cobyric acid decarboxylase-like protein/SAM-dependent methyltransferase